MKFYTKQHAYYCGIDLHAKTMYACVLDSKGKIVAQMNHNSTLAAFLPELMERFQDPRVRKSMDANLERTNFQVVTSSSQRRLPPPEPQ